MEQNTEQADALTKCVEIAPSYSKITHVTRRVNEILDLSYTDAKWRGLLKDNPAHRTTAAHPPAGRDVHARLRHPAQRRHGEAGRDGKPLPPAARAAA